jgi:hypothetical protein
MLLHLVGYSLSALDFAVWVITLGPFKTMYKLFFTKRPTVKLLGNTPDAPWRQVTYSKELIDKPYPDIVTLYDVMRTSSAKYAEKPCFGTRAYLGEGKPDPAKGQRFPPKVFGETSWMSYKEVAERMWAFGRGIRSYGLMPQPALTSGQTFDEMEGNYYLIIYENS